MRQVLGELELLSHGSTQSFNSSGRSTDDDPLGRRPPGEEWPPHLRYAQEWADAEDHAGRIVCLNRAREELAATRRRTVTPIRQETDIEFDARVIREGRGWTTKHVAMSLRTTETRVRRVRLASGVRAEDGEPISGTVPDDLTERTRMLAANGMSERQIRMLTGLHKTQIRRMLGRAA